MLSEAMTTMWSRGKKYSSSHSIFSNDSSVVWKYTTVLIIRSRSTFRQKIEESNESSPLFESRGVGGGGLVKVTLEWGLRGTVASEETLISHVCLHFNHTEFASNLTHFTEKLSKHCHFSRGWNRKTIASHFRVGTPMDLPLDLQINFSKWD